MLGAARQQLGGMDTLILNHIMNSGEAYDSRGWLGAGGGDWQRQLAIVRQTFDVNTFSFMSLATAALPELEATGGAIVVVSSMAGKMGLPAVAAYSSSKHALHGFFDSLRHDLVNSRSNVSITIAVLGSIDTESAKKGTTLPDGSPALPNVVWSPADECAAAIARGGGTPSPLRPAAQSTPRLASCCALTFTSLIACRQLFARARCIFLRWRFCLRCWFDPSPRRCSIRSSVS